MNGTDTSNEWRMNKKFNVCREIYVSLLRFIIEIGGNLHEIMLDCFMNENNCILCAGHSLFMIEKNRLHGWILVSGMTHWDDQQIMLMRWHPS